MPPRDLLREISTKPAPIGEAIFLASLLDFYKF